MGWLGLRVQLALISYIYSVHTTHTHTTRTPIIFHCILSMAVHFISFSSHQKQHFANLLIYFFSCLFFLLFGFVVFSLSLGELEVARAKNVILYTTLSNKSQERELNGLCGLLVVTNFKLSFLTHDNEQVWRATGHPSRFFSLCFCLQKCNG